MGLDLLKRLRQLINGLYKPKERQSDTGDSGSGTEGRSGTGRGDDHQQETINTPRKRRIQEDDPQLIKYRRVDNSFPRYIPNEPAEDPNPNPNKSMAEREGEREREHQQQGSKRLSIFNPPVYTQHRVRNNAPYMPNPFDLSDDEEPHSSVSASGLTRVTPQLSFSDAVRLGQNGFGGETARVNGHFSHMGHRAPPQAERSILTHELERSEHEQYLNLINTVARNNSGASSFVKPSAPPLQRSQSQPPSWSSILRGNKPCPSQQQQQPMMLTGREDREKNRELSDYAKLISGEAAQQSRLPALPKLVSLESFNNSQACAISSSDDSYSCSSSSSTSSSGSKSVAGSVLESESSVTVTADDNSDGKKSIVSKNSGAQKSYSKGLHHRFASSIYLKDDFADQFRTRIARRLEESEHLRELATQDAMRSTDERREYERKLRENIFQYRVIHKPIFVIGGLDKKTEKKEAQLIPLTEAHLNRYNDLMQGPPQQVLVTKFNLNITRNDLRTLIGGTWLNDEVINFYMGLLTDRSEKRAGQLPSVYAMNTFFVPRLLQAGHSGVKRWTRKVDLFAKDIIPVPVHCNGVHWCMAIIHMRNKTIRYYDSMGKPNQTVLDALEEYLRAESLDKRKQPFDTSGFTIESVPNVPQQANGSDCGVFSCMFAEYITRDVSLSFSQEQMEYFRKKMALEIAGGELWM
ncbi:sentrin-specific protease 1 isoform X2 [Drosophila elegans]|nr:sentrin-specific protease 1 isoform X2 [Drosophila elegans]